MLRPAQLGATRVAVILPTNTWQAYNFRDENGNGWGDTWYAKGSQSTVRLGRAFLRRGVPPQYRKYDLGFLRWLAQRGKQPDYLSETDLEVLNGDTLAKLYDLVIFGGHTEYVTPREFDAVERFRDLGGNLMFLSANNFFWQVQRRGEILTRTRKWRDIGRPESALLGVQYRGNDDGRIQRPFIVRGATTAPWLFAGTDLSDGAGFGQELGGYGIEIDATTKASPPGTIVLAEIPELYGPTFTAQMTYYETPAGAKVFAAGAIDFGGTALLPVVSRMLENLWARLSRSVAAKQIDHLPRLPCRACSRRSPRPPPERGAAAIVLLVVAPGKAAAAMRGTGAALGVSARNVGRRYAGDRPLFATVSPGIPGRDAAAIRFRLATSRHRSGSRPSRQRCERARSSGRRALGSGAASTWSTGLPSATPRRLVSHAADRHERSGRRTVLGGRRPAVVAQQKAPVVRVLGVEASFLRRSYVPGEPMELRITRRRTVADAPVLRCGPETVSTERHDELSGAPKGDRYRSTGRVSARGR